MTAHDSTRLRVAPGPRLINPRPSEAFSIPAQPAWMESGLCAQVDGDMWFPERGGSAREAKRICHLCEVESTCLAWALEKREKTGVWGGASERERSRMLRHPSSEQKPCRTCETLFFPATNQLDCSDECRMATRRRRARRAS